VADALPTWRVLAALGGLAVVCTALAFIVFFALIREVGPSRALVFTYVNLAVAVAAGVVLLSEPLTTTILVSFAPILDGSVLATAQQTDSGRTTVPQRVDELPRVRPGPPRPDRVTVRAHPWDSWRLHSVRRWSYGTTKQVFG
jgi:EamA-like transporter family